MEKLRQWVALTVVAVLAVLAAGWFLLVSPKHATAAALRQQATEQQTTNRQLGSQLAVLRAQQQALPAEQAKIAAVAVKVPPGLDEPALVRSLTAAADASGVEVVSVVPGTLATTTKSTSATSTTSTATTSTASVAGSRSPTGAAPAVTASSLPITITIAGGYFQAESYLAALEGLPRAFEVNAVAVLPGQAPGEMAGSLDDGHHLLTTITGVVFVAPTATALPAVSAPASTVTK